MSSRECHNKDKEFFNQLKHEREVCETTFYSSTSHLDNFRIQILLLKHDYSVLTTAVCKPLKEKQLRSDLTIYVFQII